jgi:hypothetical protein
MSRHPSLAKAGQTVTSFSTHCANEITKIQHLNTKTYIEGLHVLKFV